MRCRHCKHFISHDQMYGYCEKYCAQALATESCKLVKKIRKDKK